MPAAVCPREPTLIVGSRQSLNSPNLAALSFAGNSRFWGSVSLSRRVSTPSPLVSGLRCKVGPVVLS
jgi:hypothetical protein